MHGNAMQKDKTGSGKEAAGAVPDAFLRGKGLAFSGTAPGTGNANIPGGAKTL